MDPDRKRAGLWEFGERKKKPLKDKGGNGRTAEKWILCFVHCAL